MAKNNTNIGFEKQIWVRHVYFGDIFQLQIIVK